MRAVVLCLLALVLLGLLTALVELSRAALIIIGLFIGILSIISLIALLARRRRERDKLDNLSQHLQRFLHGGEPPRFSIEDSELAILEIDLASIEEQIMLERANIAREKRKTYDYIADISHQLKSPLSSLRLYTEMSLEEGGNQRAAKQLEIIEHMEEFIHTLLRLEKLRAGAFEMEFAPHDIQELIHQVIVRIKAIYPNHRLTAKVNTFILRCDERWLSEAIFNVVQNACRHSPKSGEVHIRLEEGSSSLSIIISDDGGGVPSEYLPKMFERFFTASGASGSGIGLAVSRTVVDKHHGSISARNIGNGLEVIICLAIFDGVIRINSHKAVP